MFFYDNIIEWSLNVQDFALKANRKITDPEAVTS
ncbi:MAG: hypothetical protein JWM14_2891 [Chitinophagaceae bacterium]|nr:hypothetical protein [Chitinophagaceae bacterium]